MIKYSKKALHNYYTEIKDINLDDLNKFIAQKLILNSLKVNTILPFLIAFVVVIFSFIIQRKIYVFLPQSNITSFASYMVFTGTISLLVLIIYPLLIIFLLNYLGQRVRNTFRNLFLPVKLLILTAAFFICIYFLTHSFLDLSKRIYLTTLWLCLYFLLINLYLAYLHNNNILKITKFRLIFVLIYVVLMAKPYLYMFLYTSEMINYTSVNPYIYLGKTNCQLISRPIHSENNPHNLAINDPSSVTFEPDGGCFVEWGSIRYGFASDYVLVFKKNINPVIKNNHEYNVYVRLNCYGGNCYSDDDEFVLKGDDISGELIRLNKLVRLR